MAEKPARDIEKDYPLPDFIDKLRRLADALEQGKRFEIQVAGERISVRTGRIRGGDRVSDQVVGQVSPSAA
jgi:hypothetical protein